MAKSPKVASGPVSGVAALARAEQDRQAAEQRLIEARKVAAGELGEVVLAAGAHSIPPRDLKTLLAAIVTIGPAKALELITAAAKHQQ